MSSTAVIAIVIAALVVLAAIAFVTAARRGDVRRGAGSLSRETRRKDRSTLPATGVEEQPTTGKEVERAAVAERSTALEPARSAAPAPWTPPDPETIAFTRRRFFNRSAVTLMGVGLSGFGVAVHRLPVAEGRRWLRLQDQRRQGRRPQLPDRGGQERPLPRRGPDLAGPVPEGSPAEGREGVQRRRARPA